MNELMTFLLPANGMDWFFLVLLVGWAVFAMHAAAQAKKSIDIRITSSHFKNIKSSAHDLSIASRHPVWDHIVDMHLALRLFLACWELFWVLDWQFKAQDTSWQT